MNKAITFLLSSIIALLCAATPLYSQSNNDCMDCHSDPAMTMETLTGPKSVTVTSDSLKGSVHEGLDCIDCHTDLKGVDFPHERPRHVNCGGCHEEAMKMFMAGFFNKLNDMGFRGVPECSDCHGSHSIREHADSRRVCGICHRNELAAFDKSVHSRNGKAANAEMSCTSCHDPHFKSKRDSMTTAQWHQYSIRGCMDCHKKESQNYVASQHYHKIQAGDVNAPNCVSCHGEHDILSPADPASHTSVDRLDALCATCHKGYEESLHRKDSVDARLMTCVACHTGHQTQMVHASGGIFREELPATCNRCHSDERHAKEFLAHGKVMTETEAGGVANCTQCHVYHFNRKVEGQEPRSNLRMQCENCHSREYQEYMRSEHGMAHAKGHTEAPTCITCHGEKDIKKVSDDMLPRHIIDMCSKCHGNREFALKFQLNPEVVRSYERTYHGQAYNLGYQGDEFATCVNCHGNHDIRSQDDPESKVSREKIVQTCARCHKDANENFVQFLSHYDPHGGSEGATAPQRNVTVAEKFMTSLLFFVFGFFGLHTVLWFIREIAAGRPKRSPEAVRKWVRRFDPWQRTLHITLASSFLLQAMTGLPLKFSHSSAAYWITSNVIELRTMAVIHRVGAIIMIATFVLHVLSLLYAFLVQRKKGLFYGEGSMTPNPQDAKDMWAHFKYFLGLGPKPKFGKFTYWEKFDYFAVFWGVVIIGSSGFILWYPEFFTQLLPGWMINLAHIVHSEEALLATAFIFTVHFFNGHLRPAKFPLDDVIFTGRESTEELERERQREVEHLTSHGSLDDHVIPPMKRWHKLALLTWGWTAFLTGLIVLVFIVYSMFF
ncbi:MAG: cytochrome c3 family protein [bacterium]|nr:cytochrome c3 family protein [bacterium]